MGKKIQILKERLPEPKIFSICGRDGVTILYIKIIYLYIIIYTYT